MQEMEILRLVRQGYVLATPQQLEVVIRCPDLQIEGRWVSRWALEAQASLEDCGLTPEQLRAIFGQGKARVVAELEAMVLGGKRGRVLESRRRYQLSSIDLLTDAALTGALWQHRESCLPCKRREPCSNGEELQETLAQLFPTERRKTNRA